MPKYLLIFLLLTLGALLFQLLNKAPDLQWLLERNVPAHDNGAPANQWSMEHLTDLLLDIATNLGQRRLNCFIDALDECDESQVRDMVQFFEELGQAAHEHGVKLHICFASRHYPTIDTSYGLKLKIEDEQGHKDDLMRYISSRLGTGKGKRVEDFRARVRQKANGVFMWVVLVVDILNNEFGRGYLPAVEERLNDIPAGLSDLFRDIFLRDANNMADFSLCLQWLLFARRPLRKEEFYSAMVAGLIDPSDFVQWNVGEVEDEYVK